MKTSYVKRARKFMEMFMPYLEKVEQSDSGIRSAVIAFNKDKHRFVSYHYGCTRRCLVSSDYAIKWDYSECGVETFGGCEEEVTNYKYAHEHGFGYLFAAITPIYVKGRKFYVMPRVKALAVDKGKYYNPTELLNEEEQEFIYNEMQLTDLHDENWGWINGKITIIDYACSSGDC